MNCPRCTSPEPKLHPAMQHEGEVQICTHPFHSDGEPSNDEKSISYESANLLAAVSTALMSDTPATLASQMLPIGHALRSAAYMDAVRAVRKIISLRTKLEAARKSLKAINERSATPWVVQEATDGLSMSE